MEAFNYTTQRWEGSRTKARIRASQISREIDILNSDRADEYLAFIGTVKPVESILHALREELAEIRESLHYSYR